MNILIIDNYDSFVYNIAQTLGKHNITTFVYRNDGITLNQIKKLSIDAIIISPGSGNPEDKKYFGICNNVIKILGKETPGFGHMFRTSRNSFGFWWENYQCWYH